MEAREQSRNGLMVPAISLTSTDGVARCAEYEALLASASRMIRTARRDITQGEPILVVALQDTFTTRALGAMLIEAENYITKLDSGATTTGGSSSGSTTTLDPLRGGLLPEGWVPTMLSLINKA